MIRRRTWLVRLVLPSVYTNVINDTDWISQYVNGAGIPLNEIREISWLERLVILCCVRIRERHKPVRLVLPSVFTNVANYTNWIMQYLNGAGIPFDKIGGRSGLERPVVLC